MAGESKIPLEQFERAPMTIEKVEGGNQITLECGHTTFTAIEGQTRFYCSQCLEEYLDRGC